MMMSIAARGKAKGSVTAIEPKHGLLSSILFGWPAILAVAMLLTPLGANAQMAGTGAISGSVTDSTGAVIADATVTATADDTNVATIRTTTNAGDYSITTLTPGVYTVTVVVKGFETYVQKNVTVDALQNVTVNMKLTVGTTSATVTVTAAPPLLDTADAQLGAVMDNEMYTSLPLLMGASGQPDQRRATDFAYLMPGVQNTLAASSGGNPTDASGGVNGSNPLGGTQEVYIDGVNLPEGDGVGDPRYTWTAFGVDAIDQFQIEQAGYPAQYAGQGVQNYSVKSGTNQIHGSIYEYVRNTVFDAWSAANKIPTETGAQVPPGGVCSSAVLSASTSWCNLGGIKPVEHMNEVGIAIGGPIIKNKLFLFYNYGTYRYAAGPSPKVMTIPTLAELGYGTNHPGEADFSGYAQAEGAAGCTPGTNCYDIYDPASQTLAGGGANCSSTHTCNRTAFPGDLIPANRITTAAAYVNKLMSTMPQVTGANQTSYNGNATVGYPNGLSNWYQAGRLDYTLSEKNQISLIVAFGRQSVAGGYDLAGGATNSLPPPFNSNQFYAPTTNVDILRDTWTINSHLVNQAGLAFGRYKSLDSNQDEQPQFDAAALGLLNVPPGQPTVGFPGISFSGGASGTTPTNEAGYSWHGQLQNTYTAMDNLQWQHGKHSVTFGGQDVYVQFNLWTTDGSSPLTYTFAGTQTQGYVAGSGGTLLSNTGVPYASYTLGAVSSSSVSIAPEWGARWGSPSLWVQDDFKVTPKLTVNAGVRWDLFGVIHEAHNQMTWLNPSAVNFDTGNYGTLAFAGGTLGNGPYTGLANPSRMWYKNIGPRLGAAYALNSKTVLRASYGVTFARGNWTAGGGGQKLPSQMGLIPSASAPAGLSNAPSFYWDASSCAGNPGGLAGDGITPCGWTGSTSTPASVLAQQIAAGNMPQGATLAEYGTAETATEKNSNNGSPVYWDPTLGSRSPQYINWTFGVQRELTRNMSVSVSYVGSEGHFISVSKDNWARSNGLPESMAPLSGYAFTTKTGATIAPCTGVGCQYDLLGTAATTNGVNALAAAQGYGFIPPNPYTNPASTGTGGFYQSNSVASYYEQFPQYSGMTDTTAFVGNENWNALEVTVRQRAANGLDFMVNYTWSKAIDDLGTFRVEDNTHLDRSLSAASQPQNLVGSVTYNLPVGRGHMWGDNLVYRAIVSDWTVSGIGLVHSGLPLLIAGSSCAGAPLGQCMPSVVSGQPGRINKWDRTPSGKALSWDPNNPNSVANVSYVNPAAFTVVNAGNCTAGTTASGDYHTYTGNFAPANAVAPAGNYGAYDVCNGPENYAVGTAGRVAPIKGLYSQPTYNGDVELKRTFPIYREWKLSISADMTNITNKVVLATPTNLSVTSSDDTPGALGQVNKIANFPRDVQFSGRISW
jgi:hypothetical protein